MKGGLDRIHISVLPSDERHVNIISHMVGGKCANIQYTDLTTINLDVWTQNYNEGRSEMTDDSTTRNHLPVVVKYSSNTACGT